MDWVLIFFDPRPRAVLGSDVPVSVEELVIAGRRYRLTGAALFFEWLFGEDGTVIGVEFRADMKDPIWHDAHGRFLAAGLEQGPFLWPVLWFGRRRDGATRGLQDWEDYYYQTEDGQLLVVLRTHMLNDCERASLRELLSQPDRD